MIQRLKSFSQNRFVRSVVTVATGTAGAQAITMACAPLITRIYGPEAFGLLGTFVAILAVLAPMAALTYPIAIVLPKKDSEAKILAQLSIVLAFFTSSLVLILILIWGDWLTKKLGAGEIGHYLLLIPAAMLGFALHQVMEQWLIRNHQFKLTARVTVIQSAVLNITKVVAGLLLPLAGVLIVLQALAGALHALLLWLYLRATNIAPSAAEKSLGKVASKYKDFPLFRAPEMLLNGVSQALPVIALTAFYGPVHAGFYTLSRMVLGVPVSLIGKSIKDVFYPTLSRVSDNGEDVFPLVLKSTLYLTALGAFPFGLVMVCGPLLFDLVFGEDWRTAGEYARWLALMVFFIFSNSPSVTAVPVVKFQPFQFGYTAFSLPIRALSIYIPYMLHQTSIMSIAVFCVVNSILNVVFIILVLVKCHSFDKARNRHKFHQNS